jgi:hypothetical protein
MHPPAARAIRSAEATANRPEAERVRLPGVARVIRSGRAGTRPSPRSRTVWTGGARVIRSGAGLACRRGGAKRPQGTAQVIRSGRAEMRPPDRRRTGRPAAPSGAAEVCRRGAEPVDPTGAARVIRPGRAETRRPHGDRRALRAQVSRLGADSGCRPSATVASEGQGRGAAAPWASRLRSTRASAGSASARRAFPVSAFARRSRGAWVAEGTNRL